MRHLAMELFLEENSQHRIILEGLKIPALPCQMQGKLADSSSDSQEETLCHAYIYTSGDDEQPDENE